MWLRTGAADGEAAYRITPMHFVVLSMECVIEVLAANIECSAFQVVRQRLQ
jgi:hypothetical protein